MHRHDRLTLAWPWHLWKTKETKEILKEPGGEMGQMEVDHVG